MLGNRPISGPGAPLPPLGSGCVTYHPGLAAEVVDGVEGVDGRQPSVLEADEQAAVILSQGHAVGMLTDQDEVRLEGSAERGAHSSVTQGVSPQPAGKRTEKHPYLFILCGLFSECSTLNRYFMYH